MSYFNSKLLDGYALNTTDGYTYTTQWTDVKQAFAYSVSAVFTGTPNGTLKLQASNESDIGSPWGVPAGTTTVPVWGPQPQLNGSDATNIAGATSTISAAGTVMFDVSLPGHRCVRAVYTSSSGNATVNMWINVKF